MKLKIVLVEDMPGEVCTDFLADVLHGNVLFNQKPDGTADAYTAEQAARVMGEAERQLRAQDQQLAAQAQALREQGVLIADLKEALAQFSPDKVKAVRPKKKARKAV